MQSSPTTKLYLPQNTQFEAIGDFQSILIDVFDPAVALV